METLLKFGQDHPKLVYLYALFGNMFLAFMQILFKYGQQVMSSFQLIVYRSIFLLFFNIYVLKGIKESAYVVNKETYKMVIIRGCLASTASSLMLYCVSHIPVSTVTTLFNISPIFIFFIEAFAYKTRLNVVNLCLTLVSFSGVVLIVQPQFIFGTSQATSGQSFYIGLMLISAFCRAMNMHFIHGLAKKNHPFVTIHYSHVGFLMLNSVMSNVYTSRVKVEQISLFFVLVLIGIVLTALLSQYSIFLSNSLKSPSLVMPFGYASVIVSFWADVYLFDTVFSALPIIGMVLTSAGLLSGYLKEAGQKKDQKSQEMAKESKFLNK